MDMSPKSRGLSPKTIVTRAIARADAYGIEQVSMRKLAAELSVTPMALYWHFANRDALLDAMAEHVAREVVHRDRPGAPWRERLRSVLTALLTTFRAHPWFGPLVRRRIVAAPNFLGALEILLETIQTAGYRRKAAVYVVDFAIDSLASIAAALAKVSPEEADNPSEGQLEMRERLLELPDELYPRIRNAAVPLTRTEVPAAYAKLGIEILVRGIEEAAPGNQRR
jgi:AcrR family transcriptional regulator